MAGHDSSSDVSDDDAYAHTTAVSLVTSELTTGGSLLSLDVSSASVEILSQKMANENVRQ